MDKHWTLKTTIAAAIALLMLAGGCQPVGDQFEPEGQERSVHRFQATQAASGARADAMLYGFHFDGADLNALGEQKLDLMLDDDDAVEPLVVYMNVKEDDLLNGRMEAVTLYLKDSGLADDQIRFELGDNPATRRPAAPGIEAMDRLRNQSAGDSETDQMRALGEGLGQGMGDSKESSKK